MVSKKEWYFRHCLTCPDGCSGEDWPAGLSKQTRASLLMTIFLKAFFIDRPQTATTGFRASFPFCYPLGRLPAPFSLFEGKGKAQHPMIALVSEKKDKYTSRTITTPLPDAPMDFLRRDKWPSEFEETLSPVKGTVDGSGMISTPYSTALDLKNAHDEAKERVTEGGPFCRRGYPCS